MLSVCPRLQPQIEICPQEYRGERWYLLRNTSNMSTIRFNGSAYAAIALMNGERSIENIAKRCASEYGSDAPTMEELLYLLIQLERSNCLISGFPAALKSEPVAQGVNSSGWSLKGFSPTAIRVPMWNPEKQLSRFAAFARRVFSPLCLTIWFLSVLACAPVALLHYADIEAELSSQYWVPLNVVLMVFTYLAIKFVHELSHALAIKAWGGDVREVGVMFLWLFPCPYVDGSAAAFFPDKYKRAVVSAAGIMAEVTLAALALLIFVIVEPGLVRTLALNVMVIGTVSTLFANGNPLLKFDGYYVLEDLIEIPNLSTRSQRYYLYLVQHYLFGVDDARSPQLADGERIWFVAYAPLALIYRLFLVFTIALFFSKRYLAVGVALALFAVFYQIILPVFKGTQFLAVSPKLVARRTRAVLVTSGTVLSVALLVVLVPVSTNTNAEGVVGTSSQTVIYSEVNGFAREFLVAPHTQVVKGQPLIRLENLELNLAISKLEMQLKELDIKRISAFRLNPAASNSYKVDLRTTQNELTEMEKQRQSLILRSSSDGEFVPVSATKLLGQYIEQGQLLAHVVSKGSRVVNAVVTQSEVGRIRSGIDTAHIRLAEEPLQDILATDIRETPGGSHRLPSAALGVAGGGRLPIDQQDSDGTTSVDRTFKIELALPTDVYVPRLGGRAFVRFDHPPEPVISHVARKLEQLLLRHFVL